MISRYLQLRDMNEKHLPCDLSGLLQKENGKIKKKYYNKHKRHRLVSFLSLFALYLKGTKKKEFWYLSQPVDRQFALL